MSTPATIIFDFGAVLFRWQPHDLVQEVLVRAGQAAGDDAVQEFVSHFFQDFRLGSDWGRFDLGEVDAVQLTARIATRTGLAPRLIAALINAVPLHLQPITAMRDLVHALHQRGHPLHYLSNMPRPMARHLLSNHAWLSTFRSGVFSCDAGLAKPDARIFAHAQAQFGLNHPPLFIDDSPLNIEAASRAGWEAILFESPTQIQIELSKRGIATDS